MSLQSSSFLHLSSQSRFSVQSSELGEGFAACLCDRNMENLTYFVYLGDFGTFVATAVL